MITPNLRAPLYAFNELASGYERHLKQQELLKQAVSLVTSETGFPQDEETRQLLRQTGMVNMYFFLRWIAGYANPFTRLTPELHLDMCNFYQLSRAPGTRAGGFISRKHFKDIACDTPVLTANRGWTTHRGVQPGDYVFAPSGKPVEVLAVSPTYYSNRCLKVLFTDRAAIVCGEGHQWLRWNKHHRGKEQRVEFDRQIVEAHELKPGDRIGVLESPLQYSRQELLIDPYVLGVWLGDGSTDDAQITQSVKDAEVLSNITARGYEVVEYKKARTDTVAQYRVIIRDHAKGKNTFMKRLRKMGVTGTKHIPDEYLESAEEDRWELLRGLMDTDGTTNGRGTATFVNTNKRLAEGVYELATGLGLRPRFRQHYLKLHGEPYGFYHVSFQHYIDRQPFYLTRKAKKGSQYYLKRGLRGIKSITPVESVPTNCITVEGGMYVVGEELIPTHNSSVWSIGGTAWDIVRDPDWEMVLASNIIDRSIEFNGYIQEIFSINEFVAWLYPEWVLPDGRSLHVNARETRVPCKRSNKPNVATVAVGGSIQGVHAKDEFKVDDLIGEHMLDSMNQLGAENEKASKWARSAVENIPSFRNSTRVFFCGTRYGPNDGYVWMWDDIKKFYGYTEGEPFEEKPDGSWIIYYRAVREDHGDGRGEQPIFPEEISNEYLDKVQKENPWQYWTQMMNMSTYSGLSEFVDYKVKDCQLDVGRNGELLISHYDSQEKRVVEIPLSECDVVAACDPAASERKKSVRTSKNAYLVYARHWTNKRFVLHMKSQFVPITQVFDWLFEGFKKFKGYVRGTTVEIQGPFKILKPLINEEQRRRGEVINFRGVPAKGDKDGRIRAYVQPLLDRGELYAVESARAVIEGEMMVFPDGHQKDALDALAIAEAASRRPEAPDSEWEEEDRWHERRQKMSPVTGY